MGLHNGLDLLAGDSAGRFDDLPHGITGAIAQIEHVTAAAPLQIFQCQQMSLRQVLHMDVVPHAGAVRRRVRCV